jgi:hypothetical protein
MKTSFDAMSPAELRGLLVEAVGIIASLIASFAAIRDHANDEEWAAVAEEALRLSRVGEFEALPQVEEQVRRAAAERGESE